MLILIGILGAAFGSFAGAQVWRLRARQLIEDKKAGEKVSAKELKKLSPLIKKASKDRSRCLSCGHILAWYDLIPLVSWLLLRGKCRYCKKFIGWTEFFLEVGMAALFALSVFLWPMPLASFWQIMMLVLWLAALVLLAILFVLTSLTGKILIITGLINFLIFFGKSFFSRRAPHISSRQRRKWKVIQGGRNPYQTGTAFPQKHRLNYPPHKP